MCGQGMVGASTGAGMAESMTFWKWPPRGTGSSGN